MDENRKRDTTYWSEEADMVIYQQTAKGSFSIGVGIEGMNKLISKKKKKRKLSSTILSLFNSLFQVSLNLYMYPLLCDTMQSSHVDDDDSNSNSNNTRHCLEKSPHN